MSTPKPFKSSNDIANNTNLVDPLNLHISDESIRTDEQLLADTSESSLPTEKSIKSKKVAFDTKVKVKTIKNIKSDTVHHHMIKSLKHTDPDYIQPDDELNEEHLIIDKDPTDIMDDDEQEIIDDEDDEDDEEHNDTETGEPSEHELLIRHLFNTFLNKFPHLDNYKNKPIIRSMFKMAISNIPEQINNPIFYLNFVESSISQLTQTNFNDIITNNDGN